VIVKAAPTSPFVVRQSDVLFQVLIVMVNAPSQRRVIDKAFGSDRFRTRGPPVPGRLLLALPPFDDQPFHAARLSPQGIAMCRPDPDACEAGTQLRVFSHPPGDGSPRFRIQRERQCPLIEACDPRRA
jgi:hypothetical protein